MKVLLLPLAKFDMEGIIDSISNTLLNKRAATTLADELIEGMKYIQRFPYGNAEYLSLKPLEYKENKELSCILYN